MTVKIEYTNGKIEIVEAVSKIESMGKLRRRRHGIDINGLMIETKKPSFHRHDFSDVQHFEILPVKRYP